jgi:hypothetical protein
VIVSGLYFQACVDKEKPCDGNWSVDGFIVDPTTGQGYHNLNFVVTLAGELGADDNFNELKEVGNINTKNGHFKLEYECDRSVDWSHILFNSFAGAGPISH